ncbi:hypothetical protein R3P38DRAFT_2775799 [Favolaschia claudopus]|uniref:Uncharacterized protein n=1 Tax=Favolaschia claudopus TaxID=2862362 RepID=A0AAW0BQ04_9AGAR
MAVNQRMELKFECQRGARQAVCARKALECESIAGRDVAEDIVIKRENDADSSVKGDSENIATRRGGILQPLAPRAWGDGMREDEPIPLPHSVTASSNCGDLESQVFINETIKGRDEGEDGGRGREGSGSDRPLSAAVTKRHTVFPGSSVSILFNALFGSGWRQPHRCGCGARCGGILQPLAPRAWGDGMREDEPKTETPRRGQPTRPRLTHKKRRLPNQAVNFSSLVDISIVFPSAFLVACYELPIAKICSVNVAKSCKCVNMTEIGTRCNVPTGYTSSTLAAIVEALV